MKGQKGNGNKGRRGRSITENIKSESHEENEFKEELAKMTHNNLLFANLNDYADVIAYIKKNTVKCIKTITFKVPFFIDSFNHENLSINSDNALTTLVKDYWGIKSDTDLLQILKQVNLTRPLKIFSKATSNNAERNGEILEMFSINNTIPNRNFMNGIRHNKIKTQEQKGKDRKKKILKKANINPKVPKDIIEKQKHSYLSNIIFMKYIMLFYDVEKNSFAGADTLFIYNYYLQHLDDNNKSHTQLLSEAKKALKDKENKKVLQACQVLYNSLIKIFIDKQNYPLFERIKSAFSDDPLFKVTKSPADLFRRDLMKLGCEFDYFYAEEYYKYLNQDIKDKYELLFIQTKLIFKYREILHKKYTDLVKKNKKDPNKYQNKLARLEENLPKSLTSSKPCNIPSDKPGKEKNKKIKKENDDENKNNPPERKRKRLRLIKKKDIKEEQVNNEQEDDNNIKEEKDSNDKMDIEEEEEEDKVVKKGNEGKNGRKGKRKYKLVKGLPSDNETNDCDEGIKEQK